MILLVAICVIAIPAYAMTKTVTDAKDGDTNDFDPAFNDQPFAGCGLLESFDTVTPPVLPPGWTAINAINPDGILWQTSNSGDPSPPAESLPNAAWVNDPDMISDKYLDSPSGPIQPLFNADLHFSNNYALEDGFDGGVLEISVDAGPFQDILAAGGFFSRGGYNGTISTCCGNPLAGRQAWTGNSGGFIDTDVGLTGFGGHTIALRWRMASDSSNSSEGWRVDNILIVCEGPTPTPTAPPTPSPTPTPTPTSAPCSVDSSNLGCGGTINFQPTDFSIDVTCPVDPATVHPSSFTVNDIQPDSFIILNGNFTILFHYNTTPVVQGLNTMHIPAGGFNCACGPVAEFTCTFTYEASTPTPTPNPVSSNAYADSNDHFHAERNADAEGCSNAEAASHAATAPLAFIYEQ